MNKPMEYQFRIMAEQDLPAVVGVLKSALQSNAREASIKWKMLPSASETVFSTVAVWKDQVIGLDGNIAVPFMVFGTRVLAVQGVDLAVQKEHRRIDLFLGLMDCSVDAFSRGGALFAYGFPNEEAKAVNESILGFTTVAMIPLHVKILDPFRWLAARLNSERPDQTGTSELTFPPGNESRPAGDFCISRCTSFDGRFDVFWENIRNDYPVMSVRDADRLNYRYAQAPGVRYEILCLESRDRRQIHGYAVLSIKKKKGKILDLMTARKGAPSAANFLLEHCMDWFRQKEVHAVDCWMLPHVHLYPAIKKAGFVNRMKEKRVLQIKCLPHATAGLETSSIGNAANWHLCMGDSDCG